LSAQGSLHIDSDWKDSLAECVTNQAFSPQMRRSVLCA